MELKIKRNMILALIAITLFLCFSAGLSLYQMHVIDQSYSDLINERVFKVSEAKSLLASYEYMAIMVKSYLLSGKSLYADSYRLEAQKAERQFSEMIRHIHTSRGKELAAQMQNAYIAFKNSADKALSKEATGLDHLPSGLLLQEIRQVVNASHAFVDYQQMRVDEGREENNRRVSAALLYTPFIFALGIGVLLILLFSLNRRISKQAENYALILANTRNAVITVDERGIITGINPVAEEIFSIKSEQAIGKRYARIFGLPGTALITFNYPFLQVLEEKTKLQNEEHNFIASGGKEYVLMIDSLPMVSKQGKLVGAMMIARDITQRKAREEWLSRENQELQGLVVRDGLTSLFNHKYLFDRLSDEILKASIEKSNLAFIMLDIDDFKVYNDAMGHPAGDELLKEFSQVLLSLLRPNDVLARYGGDEFAVIMLNCDVDIAMDYANNLREQVSAYSFAGRDCMPTGRLTFSAGLAVYPTNATTSRMLVKAADKALYRAKNNAKNRVELYFPILDVLQEED